MQFSSTAPAVILYNFIHSKYSFLHFPFCISMSMSFTIHKRILFKLKIEPTNKKMIIKIKTKQKQIVNNKEIQTPKNTRDFTFDKKDPKG